MGKMILQYNNDVEFILQNENKSSMTLLQEPEGWKNDDLEIIRHKQYHGIFTQFTDSLKFFKEAKAYIKFAYEEGGLNTNLYLIKRSMTRIDGEVKWDVNYIGLADFNTLEEDSDYLSIKFNSNNLETLIKSHESDGFELERRDSIDSNAITVLGDRERYAHTDGKTIISQGEQDALIPEQWSDWFDIWGSVRTKIISRGHDRFSSVDSDQLDMSGGMLSTASSMFFVDDVAAGENIDITISWDIDIKFATLLSGSIVKLYLKEFEFNGSGYTEINSQLIIDAQYKDIMYAAQGTLTKNIGHKTGFLFAIAVENGITQYLRGAYWARKFNIKVGVKSFYEGSIYRFLFVNDAMARLMEIITGKTLKFYSKLFGRDETLSRSGRSNIHYSYAEDGEYGLVGLTSGFWVRNFDPKSERYKSMQLGLKDALESLQAVFNVGVAIESVNLDQRLRVEELEFFYQETVVVRLPNPTKDFKRKVDPSLFFSGAEFGYERGGAYENEVGLDEPNTKTSFVTPLRKTTNKYNKVSKIDSDEYGRELTRRKPQLLFPDEDTGRDESNWFVDLKRTEGEYYAEKRWADRLESEPTGLLSPDTYGSMLFTPMRMLLRHGWILRAGMEQAINQDKYIKYVNSTANKNLEMHFIGEDGPIGEKDDIQVKTLQRPRFLPEIVTFKYSVNDELMKLLLGSTQVLVRGSFEQVPNLYFRIEYLNSNGEKETGYLLSLKPGSGEFELQRANENLII